MGLQRVWHDSVYLNKYSYLNFEIIPRDSFKQSEPYLWDVQENPVFQKRDVFSWKKKKKCGETDLTKKIPVLGLP